jgi:hypothetical protein
MMRRLGLAVLVALGAFVLLVTAVVAQTRLTIQPAQIMVAGVYGESVTRTLILRATAPITSVQIIRQELVRADGAAAIPTDAIHVRVITSTIAANMVLTVPVQIDLRPASSGEFTGGLLVSYSGGEATVPITARVKDPLCIPLLVLVIGVLLGLGLSWYRARGRPRDEILVRVGRLRSQIRLDPNLAGDDLARPFRERIDGLLISADAALQAEEIDAARQAVTQAAEVLTAWQMYRDDWLVQLAYRSQLVRRLAEQDVPVSAPYLLAVRQSLDDAARTAPDMEGPHELQTLLQTQAVAIERFFRIQTDLDQLNGLPRDQLGREQEAVWTRIGMQFQRRLYDLAPNDGAAAETLQQEIAARTDELTGLLAQQGAAKTGVQAPRSITDNLAVLFGPPPATRQLDAQVKGAGAGLRLTIFQWVSALVAVVLLAGAGFVELYVARTTFGASPWADYFALLAWGFGAEATRAAVTDLLRTWGVPGVGAGKSS